MGKKVILLIILGFIIGLLLYKIPWRHKINTTLEGVQCRIGDTDYCEDISVTVQGDYFSYLFKDDKFEGKILIDGYEDTLEGSWVSLQFNDAGAVLVYENIVDGMPVLNTVGTICCTSDFEQVLICISEPTDENDKSWSGENGLFIGAPADTREEAIDIAENLSAKSIWLSNTNWRSTMPTENPLSD